MNAAYRIERARADDLPKLTAIERAANRLFRGQDVAGVVEADATSLDELTTAQRAALLWVARSLDGEPIGFALLEPVDDGLHLEEMDVHPAHGRRGLGRALLEQVLTAAREAGYGALTLTTFRDIPWNAPFYAQAGFRPSAPHEIGPELAELVQEEAARGLDPRERVVMRCDLAARPPPR